MDVPGGMRLLVQQMASGAEHVLPIPRVRADGGPRPPGTPGPHVGLVMRDDLVRQYSLCSRPDELDLWRIAVLREPESTGGSRYVHEVLRPGMTVTAVGP